MGHQHESHSHIHQKQHVVKVTTYMFHLYINSIHLLLLTSVLSSQFGVTIYRFISDSIKNEQGFKLIYQTHDCDGESCNSVCRDYSAESGILTSPYYPVQYPEHTECIYTISQPNNMYINLTFLVLDIKQDDHYIEIRDGSSGESPLMGVFQGLEIPAPFQSIQNYIWIR